MCGISGIVTFSDHHTQLIPLAISMNDSLRHRGPDDEGIVIFQGAQNISLSGEDTPASLVYSSLPYAPKETYQNHLSANISLALAHRRLSIIDTSEAGHQPMCDSTGNYWLVFNGAIYNYIEIREQLEEAGHRFYSHTDTEVIIHAYMEWGESCVSFFSGMWAFVLYDKVKNKLFASKDHLGVKPFYYFKNDQYFAFASEQKALLKLPFVKKDINPAAVYDYLVLGKSELLDAPFYTEIKELSPLHNLMVDLQSGEMKFEKYNQPSFVKKWQEFNQLRFDVQKFELHELLEDIIKKRLRSDVTVGACLSGGIDSSIITGLVSKYKDFLPVFTVTSPGDKEDETAWAQKVIARYDLPWYKTKPQVSDLAHQFENLMEIQGIPCMSPNTYTHFDLMREVRQHKIKVTIDGQGADELFAGYAPYYASFVADAAGNYSGKTLLECISHERNDFADFSTTSSVLGSKLLSTLMSDSKGLSLYRQKHQEFSYIKEDFWHAYPERFKILKNKVSSNLNETLFNDYYGDNLKTMLRVGDRNSMHFGIETRMPFSDDAALAAWAFQIPATSKIKNNTSKYILREAFSTVIPDDIRTRKDKKGFSLPEKKWLRELTSSGDMLDYFQNSLKPFLDVDALRANWHSSLDKSVHSGRLWRMLCFAVWHKTISK